MKQPTSIRDEGARFYHEIAERLIEGIHDRAHPLHLISIATIGLDHTPRVRNVILRQFERETHTALFHADVRSPKIHEIQHHPRIALLCYDPVNRLQLRMAAIAQVHERDALADARWIASPIPSRRHYLTSLAPSTPVEHPRPFRHQKDSWTPDTDRRARENFCAVSCYIHTMEFLELSPDGHRRMNLSWDDDGRFHAQPLMP